MASWIKTYTAIYAILTGPSTTVVLIVVGIPGTLGDVMTRRHEWLPALADHIGSSTAAWSVSIFAAGVLIWLHWPELKARING